MNELFFFLFSDNGIQPIERSSIHLGYSCHRCHLCPITNKCYKCTTCENYYLCQDCFNLNSHNEHSFDYREVGDRGMEERLMWRF